MYIEVAAHMGNTVKRPPNTMPAFISAFEIGVDMIELDLHMTKDGEIVIIHDLTLDRTTDSKGVINQMTLEEVRKADAGIKYGEEFRGTKIPTLKEFCDLAAKMDDKIQFNFEFKDYTWDLGDFAKKSADTIISIVDSYGLWDRSFVNSFDGFLLSYIEEKYEGRFRLHGFYPYRFLGGAVPKKLHCACLMPYKNPDGTPAFKGTVNPQADFDALTSKNIEPWVGAGVKKIEDMVLAASYGARLITTDYPEFMMAELERVGLRVKEDK